MKALVQLIIGVILLVVMLYALTFKSWLQAALSLLQGGIVLGLLGIGLILIILGLTELSA